MFLVRRRRHARARCSAAPSTRTASSRRSSARTREIDEQRRFTERIIDSLPVGLYVIDRDYRIQAWNRKRETGHAGRVARRGHRPHDLRDPASPAGRAAAARVRRGLRDRPDPAVPDGVARRAATCARIASPRSRCASTTTTVTHVITIGEDVTDWRRRRSALRAGREARGHRHARRRRDARDQQPARDDRRLRREPRARLDESTRSSATRRRARTR